MIILHELLETPPFGSPSGFSGKTGASSVRCEPSFRFDEVFSPGVSFAPWPRPSPALLATLPITTWQAYGEGAKKYPVTEAPLLLPLSVEPSWAIALPPSLYRRRLRLRPGAQHEYDDQRKIKEEEEEEERRKKKKKKKKKIEEEKKKKKKKKKK